MRSRVRFPALPWKLSLNGEYSRGDHGLGRLVEFRFKGPSWHYILPYHHSHHRNNVTAPHGRPNLRSRLHCCHVQEGGPRSRQGHVVALDKKFTRTCGGGIGQKVHKDMWWWHWTKSPQGHVVALDKKFTRTRGGIGPKKIFSYH